MGKLVFQITGAFAEFERSIDGHEAAQVGNPWHEPALTIAGVPKGRVAVRRRLGRPGSEPAKIERARVQLAKGIGIAKTARLTGLGTGTVHRLKREMAGAS